MRDTPVQLSSHQPHSLLDQFRFLSQLQTLNADANTSGSLPLLGRCCLHGLAPGRHPAMGDRLPNGPVARLSWFHHPLCCDRRPLKHEEMVAQANPLDRVSPRQIRSQFRPVYVFSLETLISSSVGKTSLVCPSQWRIGTGDCVIVGGCATVDGCAIKDRWPRDSDRTAWLFCRRPTRSSLIL